METLMEFIKKVESWKLQYLQSLEDVSVPIEEIERLSKTMPHDFFTAKGEEYLELHRDPISKQRVDQASHYLSYLMQSVTRKKLLGFSSK